MSDPKYKELKEQLDRIERLLQVWIEPTIAERNRQMLTASPEARKQANKELFARKRLELKLAGKQ